MIFNTINDGEFHFKVYIAICVKYYLKGDRAGTVNI